MKTRFLFFFSGGRGEKFMEEKTYCVFLWFDKGDLFFEWAFFCSLSHLFPAIFIWECSKRGTKQRGGVGDHIYANFLFLYF